MYFLFSVIDRFAVQEDTSAARERGTGAREERDSYAWLPWRPAALNHGARGAYFLILPVTILSDAPYMLSYSYTFAIIQCDVTGY